MIIDEDGDCIDMRPGVLDRSKALIWIKNTENEIAEVYLTAAQIDELIDRLTRLKGRLRTPGRD